MNFRIFKVFIAVLVPILIVSGVALAQSGIGWFDFPGDIRVAGQVVVLDASGVTSTDFTSSDDVVVGDDLTLGGNLFTTRVTTITVDNDSTVTPTGAYQPLSAAGNVGTATIAGCSASTDGSMVTFVNGSNTTITFTDTGTLKLSGNAALGQYDTLTVLCDTANWIEIGQVNN